MLPARFVYQSMPLINQYRQLCDWVADRYAAVATPLGAIVLTVLTYLNGLGFEWRAERLGAAFKPLDIHWLYGVTQIDAALGSIDAAARLEYAISEWTLDLLYPLLYSSLFIAVLLAYAKRHSGNAIFKSALGIPFLMGICDLCENFAIAVLAVRYPIISQPWPLLASGFGALKYSLFVVVGIAYLWMTMHWLQRLVSRS